MCYYSSSVMLLLCCISFFDLQFVHSSVDVYVSSYQFLVI